MMHDDENRAIRDTLRILLLDDDMEFLSVFCKMSKFREITPVSTIVQANTILESNPNHYHVLLIDLDVDPPGTDEIDLGFGPRSNLGLRYHKWLQKHIKPIPPVLFLTAALRDDPKAKREVVEYIDRSPSNISLLEKPAKINDIEKLLVEMIKKQASDTNCRGKGGEREGDV